MSDVEDNTIVSVPKPAAPVAKKPAAKRAKRPAGKIDYPRSIAGKALTGYTLLYKSTGALPGTLKKICHDGYGVPDVMLNKLTDPREHINVWRDDKNQIMWLTKTRRSRRKSGNKEAPGWSPEPACKGTDEREYDPRTMLYNPMVHAFFAGSKLTKEDFDGDDEIMVFGCMPLSTGMREILAETGPIYDIPPEVQKITARMAASAGGDDDDDADGDDDGDDDDDDAEPKPKPAASKTKSKPAAAKSRAKRPADADENEDDEPVVPVKPVARKKVAQKPASANEDDTVDEDAPAKKTPKRKQDAEIDVAVVDKAEIPMPSLQVKPVARKKTAAANTSFSSSSDYCKAVVHTFTLGKGVDAEYTPAELSAVVACKQLSNSIHTAELLDVTCGKLGDCDAFTDPATRLTINDVPEQAAKTIQRLLKATDNHHTMAEVAFLMAINAARAAYASTLPHVNELTAQNKRLEARIAELERGQGGSDANLQERVKELEHEVRAKNVDLAALRMLASGKSPAATTPAPKKKINIALDDN